MFNIYLILYIFLHLGYSGTITAIHFFKAFQKNSVIEVTTLKLNTEYLIKFDFEFASSHDPSTDYFKIQVQGFQSMKFGSSSGQFTNPSADGLQYLQFNVDTNIIATPFVIFQATTGASIVEHTCKANSFVGSTKAIIDQSDIKTFTIIGGTITIDSISLSNRIFNQKQFYIFKLIFENSLSEGTTQSLTFTKPSSLKADPIIECSGNPSISIECSYDESKELITIIKLDTTKIQTISLKLTNPLDPIKSVVFDNFKTQIDNVQVDSNVNSLTVTGFNDGILTDLIIDSGSYKVGQSSVFIKYTFTNLNEIFTDSNIELTLPNDIEWDTSSKSCSLNFASVTECKYEQSIISNKIITVTITTSTSIPSGTSLILIINSIKTPYTFKPVTGFSFKIIKDSIEYDKMIDFGSLTMTQQSGITLTTFSRSVNENGAQSTYTFETKFDTFQPKGTRITFTLLGYQLNKVDKVEFSNLIPYTSTNLQVIQSAYTITIEFTEDINSNQNYVTKIFNILNSDIIGTITAETIKDTFKISNTNQGSSITIPSAIPNEITISSMDYEKKQLGVVDTYKFSIILFNLPPAGSTIIVTMPEKFSAEKTDCLTAVDNIQGFSVDSCLVNNQEIKIKVKNDVSQKNIQFRLNNLIRNPKSDSTNYYFKIRTQRDTSIIDQSKISDSLLQFKLNCIPTSSLFCKECDNLSNCLSCYTDISITTNIYLLNSKCISACGQKYYSDSTNNCKSCPDTCLECTSNILCQSCIDDTIYEIKNGKCVKKCTEKQFDFNGICTNCNENCNTCIDQSTKCTSCGVTNNLLYQNKCVSQCPTGIFQIGFSCIACTSPCKTCDTGPNVCLTCVTNYYYKKTSQSCVSDCGNRYYKDGIECTQCSDPCNNCSSSTICIDCLTGYYFFNNSCISSIPNGYYLSGTFLSKCTDICGNCISETECTSCPTNKYLLSKQCIDKCPDKYYSQNFVCYPCDTTCLQCSSNIICTQCPDNQQHLTGKCYQNCPNKYYSQEQQCLQCQSSCATCIDGLECKTCPISSPYMSNNLCVSSCLINYYIKEFVCIKCGNECNTCDEKGCLTCIENYKYLDQTCVTKCPSGYQDLNNIGKCEKVTVSEEQLISNLQENKYIPVPFTIVSLIMILSVVVAKMQKSETFIPGSVVGLLGLIIIGSWAVLIILQLDYILEKIEVYLLMSSIGVHIILNLINLCVIKHSIKGDIAFNQWYTERKSNSCAYIFLNILSIISFSMTRFYFSRYFGFRFLKCKLQDVENMVGMNIINGLCAFFCCIPALVASVTHSLQVIPDFFQTQRSKKKFSFEDSINGQKLNQNELYQEPSIPKIDESIEYKDSSSFKQPYQQIVQKNSKMIFKQEIQNPKQEIFNRSQEEMIIQIHSNDVSEPLSIGESQREIQDMKQKQIYEQQQQQLQQQKILEEQLKIELEKAQQLQRQLEEQNQIQEQKRIEEQLRQEELKKLELEKLEELKKIEEEIKQQELERIRREKQLEEQQKQYELLIQQQQETQRLEKLKEEERKIADLKRIEEQQQAEQIRLEELRIKEKEEENRRIQEEQKKIQDELELKKKEDEIKQLLEEQRLQELKEQEILQSKLNNVILVDQDDDDVGWNIEDEENHQYGFDQNYQKQLQKEIIQDDNNDVEDDWDAPTSGFVSIQPKFQLKKEKQIEEPQNPFKGDIQKNPAQSDSFKQSKDDLDDDEDWALNQLSPSEFNNLNQRYNNEDNQHSVTQVQRSQMFSTTDKNFTSLAKRPTQPEPYTISDNESINQYEQFSINKYNQVPKKQNQKLNKRMQLQRQKIKKRGKNNISINDIQF
ncbi:unnamed protein product [Paramecium primaurelia]|uniref:TNFR-Cys domain-containing protein n=1 Tax=Paramecium primaurelia TaxID=5886 RepID=A0A8S1KX26_PARPR|nr:unnamed protein product [Paramecium primaurelia]